MKWKHLVQRNASVVAAAVVGQIENQLLWLADEK